MKGKNDTASGSDNMGRKTLHNSQSTKSRSP